MEETKRIDKIKGNGMYIVCIGCTYIGFSNRVGKQYII